MNKLSNSLKFWNKGEKLLSVGLFLFIVSSIYLFVTEGLKTSFWEKVEKNFNVSGLFLNHESVGDIGITYPNKIAIALSLLLLVACIIFINLLTKFAKNLSHTKLQSTRIISSIFILLAGIASIFWFYNQRFQNTNLLEGKIILLSLLARFSPVIYMVFVILFYILFVVLLNTEKQHVSNQILKILVFLCLILFAVKSLIGAKLTTSHDYVANLYATNYQACLTIRNFDQRNSCLSRVAKIQGDPSICEFVTGTRGFTSRGECTQIASSTKERQDLQSARIRSHLTIEEYGKNISFCDGLSSDFDRTDCYVFNVQNGGEKSVCEKIPQNSQLLGPKGRLDRDACYIKFLDSHKRTTSRNERLEICGKIIGDNYPDLNHCFGPISNLVKNDCLLLGASPEPAANKVCLEKAK